MNTHIIRLDFRGYIHLLQTRQLKTEIVSTDELVLDLVVWLVLHRLRIEDLIFGFLKAVESALVFGRQLFVFRR